MAVRVTGTYFTVSGDRLFGSAACWPGCRSRSAYEVVLRTFIERHF